MEAAQKALEKLKAEQEARKKTHPKDESKKKEPAASTTDPEARRMRFADGAVRAGYNAQLAVTAEHGFIVAIEVTDRRNDAGFARPMAEAVEARLGQTPGLCLPIRITQPPAISKRLAAGLKTPSLFMRRPSP